MHTKQQIIDALRLAAAREYKAADGSFFDRDFLVCLWDAEDIVAASMTAHAALQAVEREGRDANADGDVVIPSEVWDMIRAALAQVAA